MADATGILNVSPVIPVMTIDDPPQAFPVARALADGGVRIIELTLRTASALIPVLPGVATVGEVMMVLEHGLKAMKFSPAGPAGGPDYLAAIGAPIPPVQFCPQAASA